MRAIHFSCFGTPMPTQSTSGRASLIWSTSASSSSLGHRPERRRVAADDVDARVAPAQVERELDERALVAPAVEPDAVAALGAAVAVAEHQLRAVDAVRQVRAEHVRRPDDRHPVGQRRAWRRGAPPPSPGRRRPTRQRVHRRRRRRSRARALATMPSITSIAPLVVGHRDRDAEDLARRDLGGGGRGVRARPPLAAAGCRCILAAGKCNPRESPPMRRVSWRRMRGPGEARLLASGALLQQVAQASGLVALLVIVTLLARRLSVAELGAYGLVASLAGYLLVLRNSVASSAVRAMAAAPRARRARATCSPPRRRCTPSWGWPRALLIALVAAVLAATILDGELADDARAGGLGLGASRRSGIAASVYLDALRAERMFAAAARAEIVAVGALPRADGRADPRRARTSPWSSPSAARCRCSAGCICAVVVRRAAAAAPARARRAPRGAHRAAIVPTAGWLLVVELSNLVMYASGRIVLGAYRTPTAVGQYEGPVRAHNLLYALGGALAVPTVPTASRYVAAGDRRRLRRAGRARQPLHARAVRAAVRDADDARRADPRGLARASATRTGRRRSAILVSYWLLYGGADRDARLPRRRGRGARGRGSRSRPPRALNLALALVLTPELGIEGPALATAVGARRRPSRCCSARACARPGVPLGELLGRAAIPAYTLGALLAGGAAGAAASALEPETLPAVAASRSAGCSPTGSPSTHSCSTPPSAAARGLFGPAFEPELAQQRRLAVARGGSAARAPASSMPTSGSSKRKPDSRAPGRSRRSSCRGRRPPPRGRRSRARSRPGRRAGGGARRPARNPPSCRTLGEPGRMSTSTSRILPRAQRTSFAMPGWKCIPRSTPLPEREWLSCTHSSWMPSSASVVAREVSRKKPRASPWTTGSSKDRALQAGLQSSHARSEATHALGDQARQRERRGGRRGRARCARAARARCPDTTKSSTSRPSRAERLRADAR